MIVLGGCGGSSGGSSSASSSPATTAAPASTTPAAAPAPSGGAGQTVHLSAVPGRLSFSTTHLTAKAGTVTVSMSNPSSFPHGVSIQGHGIATGGKVVGHGGVSSITAKLRAGTYTFYCPVPGHRQAGMQGTITVT
ncbi:MAG TPA: cupredoxin domain-containing protein [Solirubrobacteraceae bacterium]|nr:cupredoxin domain-containing protein [Solirubrobacteraceae bacterium]